MKNQFLMLLLLVLIGQLSGHGLGSTTSVKRKNIRQPIEQLFENLSKEKLKVSSYDFNAHRVVTSCAKSTGESTSNCYFQISFDDNPHNDILCTPSQEFYDVHAQHWAPALQLRVGGELLSAHGKQAITSIRFIKKPLKVYSLEIENTHNFFVGTYAILTHNILIPWVLSAGLGISFGAGAAAGGTAGGCLGPITLVGGAVIGGIIGIAIKMVADDRKASYHLHFDVDTIENYYKTNTLYKENNNDAQAPGKPTENDGFIPKKNWDGKKVRHPKTRQYGWPDKKGNIWVPTGPGSKAHGGHHWDVIAPNGTDYDNVYPGGTIRKGRK